MNNRVGSTNIGASSILVIVIILSLVSFAGLSLASANADYIMCQKLADRTKDYYAATSAAYEELYSVCEVNKDTVPDSYEYRLDVNINNNQSLRLGAYIYPEKEIKYDIISFKVVTVNKPEMDNSLSLLLK